MGGCDNDDDNNDPDGGSDGVRDCDNASDVDQMTIPRSYFGPSYLRLPVFSVVSCLSARCHNNSLSPSRTSSTEWFGVRGSRQARHGRHCRIDGMQGKEKRRE